ncbi:MAG: HAD family hydrolase [Flavobacteriia bacterium]|jgi:phosphoglycolate phosphatase
MNIFFDLDGTIIESRKRLYMLFQFLVASSDLTFDEYWELKRNGISHKSILTTQFNYTSEDYSAFESLWMNEIEKEEWLNLDEPIMGVTDLLLSLTAEHRLHLVTARQSKDMVYKQLANFGWNHIFENILVTEQKSDKHSLILKNVLVSLEDWLIGDTGKDIEAGKKLGINTAAVLSGFLNQEKLASYQPDLILTDVTLFQLNSHSNE